MPPQKKNLPNPHPPPVVNNSHTINDDAIFSVARIAAPYGIKGWVKLNLLGLTPKLLQELDTWFIESDLKNWQEIKPVNTKVHNKLLLVQFANVNDRDAASLLRHKFIGIKRNDFPQLPKDTYYWSDLIDMAVYGINDKLLGKVASLIESPANSILSVVNEQQQEILIPLISTYITDINLEKKEIYTKWDVDY